MKYLFFDIECSVVSKKFAKICAFGYCLTDEQFHILEKEDILINPQGGFHLTDRKGTQGLVLPYEYSSFKKHPTFTQVSDKIYGLLQDKDTLVFGHATQNDVKYLNLESNRFQLPSFSFEFWDTQFLYMNHIGVFSRQFGLGSIAEELGVEFTAHRAVDDAYATMKVAQALCLAEGLPLTALIKKYEITPGKIENYEITPTQSVPCARYKAEQEKKKEAREKLKTEFYRFADREKRRRAKDGKLKNKTVCFSHPLEIELPLSKRLLASVFAQAGWFTSHAESCDVYVCFEDEVGPRLQSAIDGKSRVFTPKEFEEFLSV
jgi:DNA polymerase III alpha subunit (gram-positive type)